MLSGLRAFVITTFLLGKKQIKAGVFLIPFFGAYATLAHASPKKYSV